MFREELTKILTNKVFYLAIAAVVVLLLLGNIYTSLETGEEYTVIGLALDDEKEEVIGIGDLHARDIMITGVPGYLEMFVPIIVAIPFIIGVCGEKKNSITRFEISRVGKTRYITGKYMAAMFSGGLIVLLGYIIFCLIIYFIFPKGTGMSIRIENDFLQNKSGLTSMLYKQIGINALIIMKFIRMFLYGAVSVICAFGISMINRNKYIVISIPFMLNYLFEKFVQKGKYPKLYNALVTNIEEVYIVDMKEELIIFGSITILIMVLCRIYIGRKCDCGEE